MRPAGFGWIGWLLAGVLLAAGGALLIALRAYDEHRTRSRPMRASCTAC
ncbi:MAG: hypothetical protein U1F25_07450 [Rubrivivax sp.]